MKKLVLALLLLACSPAAAQWQTPNHSVPIGRGGGVIGFGNVAPGVTDLPFLSNGASADPSFRVLPNSGLANEAANTIKCNPTGAPAAVQDCTIAQVSAMLFPATTAVTGTYALLPGDCGKTVTAGGSAFYTVTVNAASGYAAQCSIVVINTDNVCPLNGASTCRGKTLAINGYANFILWPGQIVRLFNQSNVWQYNQPGRWAPLVGMTWHVNHAIGSNSNDGLAIGAAAFATMQRCVDVMESLIDFGQADVGPACQNDPETFTENNVSHTHPLTGYHVISVTGDTTTPANVVWQVSGSGNVATNCRDGGNSIITGFKFVSTGTGNFFINGGQLGVCDFGAVEFGANAAGYDLYQSPGGAINFGGGAVKVSGDMAGFLLSTGGGHVLIDGMALTLPNALTFTNFLQMSSLGQVSATSVTCSGTGCAAGSVGKKYDVQLNAVLGLSGSVMPGATGGSTATGGQVVP